MDADFRDRKIKVLAVESSGASRTLLIEVIRSLGFKDVQGASTLKDAMGILEVEPIGWLITTVCSDQPENMFQLLKLCCQMPELKELRISAMIEDAELEIMPSAFERGLMSYHRKPYTKDSLKKDLESLLGDFEKHNWSTTHLSASYLRQCLVQRGFFDELLAFEKNLIKASPCDIQQFFNLALPMIKTQRIEEAKAVLAQVQKLEPAMEKQVKAMASSYFGGEDLTAIKAVPVNVMNIKTVLIVDSDSAVQNEVKSALMELGVEDIQIFSDGRAALEYIEKNNNPDLIIHEWRIPKLTGPIFLQKAKEEGARSTLFMLYSGLIEKSDAPFIKEMGVINVIPKPVQRNDLIKEIIWSVQQDRSPTDKNSMERKIRLCLDKKQMEEAYKLKSQYIADPNFNLGSKQVIEAECAYADGKYESARDLAIEGIKNGGESIFILNLLGKSMIQLRDLDTALKCFQKAQKLAPSNVERLCQIAEIHAELDENEKSENILSQVRDIDPDSEKAKESEAKIALNRGDSTTARAIMGQLKAMENVVSYMNNRAIAMARCSMIKEGIEQYLKTIESIPDNRADIQSIVHYNLALAYLRNQRIDDAMKYLELSQKSEGSKVKEKAEKLLKKLKVSQAKGLPIRMAMIEVKAPPSEAPPVSKSATDEKEQKKAILSAAEKNKNRVIMAMDVKAGDRCCYLIYQCHLALPPKVTELLSGELKFAHRNAIEREETRGADILNASNN